MMWDFQLVNCRLSWSLGVLIPILSLHHVVKACSGLPSSLILLFFLQLDLVLIHYWESKAQMLGWISVELCGILGNFLTQLFLLELPDVQLLVAVLEHINTLWYIQPFLWRCSKAHWTDLPNVLAPEVFFCSTGSLLKSQLELPILAIRVSFSLGLSLLL